MRSNLVGLGVVLALVAGCDRNKAQDAPEAGDIAATAPAAGSVDVSAPPPVVSGEPDIPLNEAVVGTTPVPADFAADTAPPAPASEEQPASPEASDVWCPGYWWWSMASHRYVWVSGAWRNPPPEQVWTPGMWVSSGERYVWVPGFWGPRGAPPAAPVAMAPPPPPFETRPPPPEVGYVWGPGYYAWRGERYTWVEGGWMRPRVGYGWVEPRWVDYGGRHFFQPGRWDHDVSRRGTVYLPDPNARPGVRFTPVAANAAIVAQHEGYNSAAARAIARGATRQSNGTISWRGPEHGGAGGPAGQGGEHGGQGGPGAGPGGEHGGQGGEHGGQGGGQGGEHGGQGGEHGGQGGGQGGEHGGPGGQGGNPLHEPPGGREHGGAPSAAAIGHGPPQQLHGQNPVEHPSIPAEGAGSAHRRPH